MRAVKASYRVRPLRRILFAMTHPVRDAGPVSGLVIVNARVWTNDSRRRWADAVLVRGATVLAVGSSAALRKRAGAGATLVDARGWLVLPTGEGRTLEPGAPASLLIAERATTVEPPAPADPTAVVFALADGQVVLDHYALAR